jgi:hypothetical protein
MSITVTGKNLFLEQLLAEELKHKGFEVQLDEAKYWLSPVGAKDDFEQAITDTFIDGKTKRGPWATMSPASWKKNGVGKLGTGYGQKYEKQKDGKWLKIEG